MRVYIAARYSRHEEMRGYADELEAAGVRVTARWINGDHKAFDDDPGPRALEFAQDDIDDLLAADTFVTFTEPPHSDASRGGRHVEFGIALGMRWWGPVHRRFRIVVVGHRENVFHWLPEVEFYATWGEAKAALLAPRPVASTTDPNEGVPV